MEDLTKQPLTLGFIISIASFVATLMAVGWWSGSLYRDVTDLDRRVTILENKLEVLSNALSKTNVDLILTNSKVERNERRLNTLMGDR